jgi:cytochrome c oxidase subunit 2
VGCAENKPQDILDPAGPFARAPDHLWNITFTIAAVIFFLVEGLLVVALVKFRHRPERRAAQVHGNTTLEIMWTAIPALILAFVGVLTVRQIFALAHEPPNALPVTVIGHQFWWEYQYPTLGIKTANELHIPAGRPVWVTTRGAPTEQVTGLAEVIHSFWVPRLAGKQDVIPGHEAHIGLEADHPGRYKGECTEFCGVGHADMRLRVFAQAPAQFARWVAAQKRPAVKPPPGSLAAQGARLFQNGSSKGQFPNGPACASCHALSTAISAQPTTGPNLTHVASRTTFAGATFPFTSRYLSLWVHNPVSIKPGAKMPMLGLTPSQVKAVVAYLRTLK